MRRIRVLCVLLMLAIGCIARVDARRKQQDAETAPSVDGSDHDEVQVHFVFEMIGKEIYKYLDCRKYRFYIKMMSGYNLPDEREAIIFIEGLCNVLYGISILVGFLFLSRGPMLIGTLCTLYVGPAVILLLLGAIILMLVAFAMYPFSSVLVIWMWFFLTSQIAQFIGLQLGLDHDGDGDVDCLDILSYLADTKIGKSIGLQHLQYRLNRLSMDPLQAINNQLDHITKRMDAESEILNKNIKNGSITVSPSKK